MRPTQSYLCKLLCSFTLCLLTLLLLAAPESQAQDLRKSIQDKREEIEGDFEADMHFVGADGEEVIQKRPGYPFTDSRYKGAKQQALGWVEKAEALFQQHESLEQEYESLREQQRRSRGEEVRRLEYQANALIRKLDELARQIYEDLNKASEAGRLAVKVIEDDVQKQVDTDVYHVNEYPQQQRRQSQQFQLGVEQNEIRNNRKNSEYSPAQKVPTNPPRPRPITGKVNESGPRKGPGKKQNPTPDSGGPNTKPPFNLRVTDDDPNAKPGPCREGTIRVPTPTGGRDLIKVRILEAHPNGDWVQGAIMPTTTPYYDHVRGYVQRFPRTKMHYFFIKNLWHQGQQSQITSNNLRVTLGPLIMCN